MHTEIVPICTRFYPMIPAKHVIICGQRWLYSEKAPFVASGRSLYGALEYSEDSDTVRCHECGLWCNHLGVHVISHGITAKEYKQRHGLFLKTPLTGLRQSEKKRRIARERNQESVKKAKAAITIPGHRFMSPVRASGEIRNKNGTCRAQLLHRLNMLSKRLGRYPTTIEVDSAVLDHQTLSHHFGGLPLSKILEMVPAPEKASLDDAFMLAALQRRRDVA